MRTLTPPVCWELGRGIVEVAEAVAVFPVPQVSAVDEVEEAVEVDELDTADEELMKLAALNVANVEQGKSVLSESGCENSPQFGLTVPEAGKKLVGSSGIRIPNPMSLTEAPVHNPAFRFSVSIKVVVVPSPTVT